MSLLFYEADCRNRSFREETLHFEGVEVWRPSWKKIVPRGLPLYPFAVFWILHALRIFDNRGYAVILIRDQRRVIHRCTIFPRYFRFPFMGRVDVQVGMWTHAAYRNRGLAQLALRQALALASAESRKLWFIVNERNLSSLLVASKVGLASVGRGRQFSWLGLRILSRFVLEVPSQPTESLRSLNNSSVGIGTQCSSLGKYDTESADSLL